MYERACSLRNLEGATLLCTGNHFSDVDLISPPIVRMAALRCLSTFFVCALLSQTGGTILDC